MDWVLQWAAIAAGCVLLVIFVGIVEGARQRREADERVAAALRDMLRDAVLSHRPDGMTSDVQSLLSDLMGLSHAERAEWRVSPHMVSLTDGLHEVPPGFPLAATVGGSWDVVHMGKREGSTVWETGWTVTLEARSIDAWEDLGELRAQWGGVTEGG
jgi:hypothetical protein